MGRLQKRCSLFGYIYRHFRCRHDAGSLSDVAAGLQGKEIFQHLIRYHDVFQRRSDPYLPAHQQYRSAGFHVGGYPAGCIQRLEYDHCFPIPILLAFLLNRIKSNKIKQKVQLVLYMPNFISVIVLCGIVRVLLSVTGPVNGLFHTGINFMTLPEAFRPIYIISGIWQGAGWSSIMYTAALSNASQELKEAAMLDGANLIQQIRTVEWPAIKDMVVIQFILQAGNIMSIGFEKAYALQTDLNLDSAEIIATYVYKKGLLDGDYSFSTAVGLFNTVINVILLIAVNKVVAKMNDGQGL